MNLNNSDDNCVGNEWTERNSLHISQMCSMATILLETLEIWRITILTEFGGNKPMDNCAFITRPVGSKINKTGRKKEISRLNKYFEDCRDTEELFSKALEVVSDWTKLEQFKIFIRIKFFVVEEITLSRRRAIVHCRTPKDRSSPHHILKELTKKEADVIDKYEGELLKCTIHYRLVKKWESARTYQQEYLYGTKEKVIYDEIEHYRTLINMESEFTAQQEYLADLIDHWANTLESRMKRYDNKVEELDYERQYLVTTIESKRERYKHMQERYREREEILLEIRKVRAAVTIQKWWRSILEERGLLNRKEVKRKKTKKAKKGSKKNKKNKK